MTIISIAQGYADALKAGFTSAQAAIIDAIAQAESGANGGLDTVAHNPGTPGHPENSYGVLQINLLAHPEVSVAQAEDPQQAFNYAYKLSQAGTKFSDWTTYNTGAYLSTPAWQHYGTGGGGGSIQPSQVSTTASPMSTTGVCIPPTEQGWNIGAWIAYFQCLTTSQANGVPAAGDVASNAATSIWQSFLSLVGPFLERAGLFVLALVVILTGIVFIAYDPAKKAAGEALKVGALAA